MRSSPLRTGNAMPPRRPARCSLLLADEAPLGERRRRARRGRPLLPHASREARARSRTRARGWRARTAPKSRSRFAPVRDAAQHAVRRPSSRTARPRGRAAARSPRAAAGAASSKLSDSASARATPYWTCSRAASRSRSVRSRAMSTASSAADRHHDDADDVRAAAEGPIGRRAGRHERDREQRDRTRSGGPWRPSPRSAAPASEQLNQHARLSPTAGRRPATTAMAARASRNRPAARGQRPP